MPLVEPLPWVVASDISAFEHALAKPWERTPGWTTQGYKSKREASSLANTLAVERMRRLQPAFASRTQQHSGYALTHSLSYSPCAKESKHATADVPLYAPKSDWLREPTRKSAAFSCKVKRQTKANVHPRIPPSAPDCWSRRAISAETWEPLHVATSARAGWLRPMVTPAARERTGEGRYSNVVSWPIAAPGPGCLVGDGFGHAVARTERSQSAGWW
jgi:hypothetical protein